MPGWMKVILFLVIGFGMFLLLARLTDYLRYNRSRNFNPR